MTEEVVSLLRELVETRQRMYDRDLELKSGVSAADQDQRFIDLIEAKLRLAEAEE
jgi:hypothetical protein